MEDHSREKITREEYRSDRLLSVWKHVQIGMYYRLIATLKLQVGTLAKTVLQCCVQCLRRDGDRGRGGGGWWSLTLPAPIW